MAFQQGRFATDFNKWVFSEIENKILLWFTLIIIVISFGWLKFIYPYPNFMPPDSYSYLEAASKNDLINIWPIGYSRFLRLVSCFSNSHFVLVTIQYLLLMAALLYFLFTVRYFLTPGKWTFRIIFAVSVINPLLPHISNFVSSDALFASLSLIWFTQLMWIIYEPSKKLILAHSFTLLLAFMVRFVALYYPILSVTIIALIHMPRRTKWFGFLSVSLLLSFFIGITQHEYYTKTNTIQFSAFGGWQLAANALYGYAHVDKPDDPAILPVNLRNLHRLVNQHMDSIRQLSNRPDKNVGIYYLWDFKSPLRLYMAQHGKDTAVSWFKQWAYMAPLYQQYGRWLIMKHPWEFAKYYLWPNFLKYYAPPLMFMGYYNQQFETVQPIAVTWFHWNNDKLPIRAQDRIIHITKIFPTMFSIINPLFLLGSIAFSLCGGFRKCTIISKKIIILSWFIWLINMAFSTFSAPTELRYHLFPIIITIPFCCLFTQWIIRSFQIDPEANIQQPFEMSKPVT